MSDSTPLEELLLLAIPCPTEKFYRDLHKDAMQTYDDTFHRANRESLKPNWLRPLGWMGALTLFLTFSLMATTPGRALAQRIIQFGLFIFTDQPTAAEQTLTAIPNVKYTPQVKKADLLLASEVAGFPVYYPTFLPEGYVPLTNEPNNPVEVLFNSEGDVLKVDAMFEQNESRKILSFSQIHLDPVADIPPLEFGTGQTEPQFVTVAGNDGVWLQNFVWGTGFDETGNQVPVPYNLLIWEITTEDGYRFQFWLGSEERLSLGVMMQIAESIAR